MKYFLFLFTLLFSTAQAQDSIFIRGKPSIKYIDSLLNLANKTDTIIVTLLVSEHERHIIGVTDKVYTMPAYSVRKWDRDLTSYNPTTGQFNKVVWVHFKYLDILKRPLGENIIVWLSK